MTMLGPRNPIRRHVSAIVNRTMMGDGDWTLKNGRWGDGTLKIRKGVPSALLSAPSGLSTVIEFAEANLNGQEFAVLAGSDGSKIRVWVSPFPQSPARWIEITGTNQFSGPSGDTRFPTVSSQVSFAVAKTPRFTASGTTVYSRDVLVIQNGEDYARIWDPGYTGYSEAIASVSGTGTITISTAPSTHNLATGDCVFISGGDSQINGFWTITRTSATAFTLNGSNGSGTYSGTGTIYLPQMGVHKPLTLPDSAYSLISEASFTRYLPVANGARAYFAAAGPPLVNQAVFLCAQTTVAPYTGTNVCFKINATTGVADGNIATVRWTAASANLEGEQICFFCQGINNYAEIMAMMKSVKIEISPDNVAYNLATNWYTIYDPSGSAVTRSVFVVDENTTAFRAMVVFNVKNVSDSNRTTYQIRFTWKGDPPAANIGVRILMIASSYSGAFPGGTSWTGTYEDQLGYVESAALPYAPNTDSALLSAVGGPTQALSGSAAEQSPNIPVSTSVYYQYSLTWKNSDGGSTVSGGLDGLPQVFNVYARLPGDVRAYYLASYSVYSRIFIGGVPPTKGWAKAFSTNYITQVLNVFRFNIYSNRPAPSPFQIPMPIATSVLYASGRLFAGGIKESSTNIRSDGYFSGDRQPFRFQGQLENVNGVPDETGGLYFQIAGETVKALAATSASSQSANRIYCWTDKGFYALGRNDPFIGSGFDASLLSTATKISERGTNSPRSIAQFLGILYWLDNESQVQRFAGGQGFQVSKYQVDDQTTAIPASRRDDVCGAFFGGRYYMPYSATGTTVNEKCLVWLEAFTAFESDDVPPQDMERIATVYDSSQAGSGQRLLFVDNAGVMYAYEEGTTDSGSGVSISWKSRGVASANVQGEDPWATVSINDGWVSAEDMTATLTFNRYYEPTASGTPFASTIDLDTTQDRTVRYTSRTVTPTGQQGGEQAYFELSGQLTGNKSFYRADAEFVIHSNPAGDRP